MLGNVMRRFEVADSERPAFKQLEKEAVEMMRGLEGGVGVDGRA